MANQVGQEPPQNDRPCRSGSSPGMPDSTIRCGEPPSGVAPGAADGAVVHRRVVGAVMGGTYVTIEGANVSVTEVRVQNPIRRC